MSLKNAPKPKQGQGYAIGHGSWSLAARLTLWFFTTSFACVLVATIYLYLALAANLDREDDHFLNERMQGVEAVLQTWPTGKEAVEKMFSARERQHAESTIYLRLLTKERHGIVETSGMDDLAPPSAFTMSEVRDNSAGRNYRAANGNWLRIREVLVNAGPAHDQPLLLQAAMDRSHEEELLENYRRHLWIVLGTALLVCSLGSYLLIQRAIQPLQQMAAVAARIRSSTLDERILMNDLPAELRSLSDTFNEMLDRLQSSFERLSQFSADIAHELRTPLNNLRGEAEVALRRSRTLEEYRAVIESSLEEFGKLSRLIDRLLFLARAENPAMQICCELVDVGEELERLREFYDATASEAQIKFTVGCEESIVALLDRTLFQRAVGNLLENAFAHTPPHGNVTVTATQQDHSLVIRVTDTGEGIEPQHLEHLFDRFYRADPARKVGPQTHWGLGLPMVKSIATLHLGKVEVTSQVGHGTTVTLSLPREVDVLHK